MRHAAWPGPVPLRLLDVAVILLLAFYIVTPLATLSILAVTEEWGETFGGKFTLRWLSLVPQIFGRAIGYSLLLATTTMLGTLVVASAVAYGTLTRRLRASGLVDAVMMLPLTLSHVVIGLALIVTYNRPPLQLHGTLWLLIFGHFIVALPLSYRTVRSVMAAADLSLVEAAVSLGASEAQAVRRVVLPLIAPGIVASSLLAFMTSLENYALTFMIAPERIQTLPLQIFSYIFAETGGQTNYNLAAAMSLVMVAFILAAVGLVKVLTGQSWQENLNV